MKWRKLGRIFDPRKFKLANDCFEYAQAPQALVFENYVRIYFSTRKKDPVNGKYLSHISFVDMDKNLEKILNVSSHSVIELGKLGCYDEHGIFPLNVLRNGDKIFGYIGGWNRKVSVSVDTSIGLAVSLNNGYTFQRIGDGPVLTSSLNEPFLVGDPFVNIFKKRFYMFYIFGVQWKKYVKDQPPDRIYKIGYAISNDGVTWHKKEEGQQIIADQIGIDESQAMPTVANFNGSYHLFFCYRQSFDFRMNRERSYRIGYACSDDLISWVRNDEVSGIDVTKDCWDSDMLCYPHIFQCEGKIYMLYNGNEFGRYGFGVAILEEI